MHAFTSRVLAHLFLGLTLGCAAGAGDDAETSFGPGGGPGSASDGTDSTGTGGGSDSGSGTTTTGPTSTSGNTTSPDCQDQDTDGYGDGCAAGPDCDDMNPDINPGAVETCNGVDDNCDELIDNGCECDPDGVSETCNMPTDLGPVDVGGMSVGPVANVAQEGGIDWYTVQFPAASRPGGGTPTLSLVVNEAEAFAFDVVGSSCVATGLPCQTGGDTSMNAVGLTDWSFTDDDPGCCTAPNDGVVGWPNQVWIRVYRTSAGTSCAEYQLQATR